MPVFLLSVQRACDEERAVTGMDVEHVIHIRVPVYHVPVHNTHTIEYNEIEYIIRQSNLWVHKIVQYVISPTLIYCL